MFETPFLLLFTTLKATLISSARFLAHLVNQRVCDSSTIFEICVLLLTNPSDDSVEAAVELIKECGYELEEQSREGLNCIVFYLIIF